MKFSNLLIILLTLNHKRPLYKPSFLFYGNNINSSTQQHSAGCQISKPDISTI